MFKKYVLNRAQNKIRAQPDQTQFIISSKFV